LEEKGVEIKKEEGKKARDKQLGVLSNIDKTPFEKSPQPKHDTRKQIASELGWSSGKTAMADKTIL
jgi:predicted nucleotidyltransferase